MIRMAVKNWVKLPPSTTDGVLYAVNKDGGLAIPKLKMILSEAKAKTLKRLTRFSFSVIPEVLVAITDEKNSISGTLGRGKALSPGELRKRLAGNGFPHRA
ncbi:hypothetical protein AVEN_107590-1 [Araneus ventricosus]|uniref:Uncharacterized protein n=1 Tax=Araneus ventricosus TaxID=182803 RepID=A0A4Y2K319_ARAVE|nr:hypothetical protein AVEN_107590-1 [Araneus ventricosus]